MELENFSYQHQEIRDNKHLHKSLYICAKTVKVWKLYLDPCLKYLAGFPIQLADPVIETNVL